MDSKKNIANAQAVFAKNKSVKQLYFTTDGQAFAEPDPAKTHQKELTGSADGLHLVKNADYEGPAVSVTEDVVGADKTKQPKGDKKEKDKN